MNSADCHSSVVEPPSVSPLSTPELQTLPTFGDAPPIDSFTCLRILTRSAPEQIPRSPITLNPVIPTLMVPIISIDGEQQHPVDIEGPRAAPSIIDIACLARTLLVPSPETVNSETRTLVSPTAATVEGKQQQQPVDIDAPRVAPSIIDIACLARTLLSPSFNTLNSETAILVSPTATVEAEQLQQAGDLGILAAQKAPEASTVTVIGLPTPDSMPHHAAAAPVSQIIPPAPAFLMSMSYDFESPPTAFPAPPSTRSEGSDEGPGSPVSISTPTADSETSVETNQSMSEPVSSPLSDRSTTPSPPEGWKLGYPAHC
ncbi:hypothetical protein B0T09DRAFT_50454 [Sordaria sp. MPI-SDFR-AT-0083]|nr:hypothetical protein B0T09DRAFT_50454 [Sordaria sp. MPI-SDFR-AT-0083]